jgi:hypothetical protein
MTISRIQVAMMGERFMADTSSKIRPTLEEVMQILWNKWMKQSDLHSQDIWENFLST